MIYKNLIRPILFLFDAEKVHDFTLNILSLINKSKILNNLTFSLFNYTSPRLKQKFWGLYFRTPVGLAAGIEKKAKLPLLWSAFDFGWAQLGSFSYQAQAGNKKPRLWRMIPEQGIIVYSGLPHKGAQAMAKIISQNKQRYPKRGLWSISIAKSTNVALEEAPDDYGQSFQTLEPLADIMTINLSCPNVKGFSSLQAPALLEPILQKITSLNKLNKPIWLKISNDLNKEQLDDIITLAKQYKIQAIIAANLSKNRDKLNLAKKYQDKPGGVSGKLIAKQANKIIAYLYKHSQGRYRIIGCGGIFNGQDAFDKIKAGANLLQIATGFIYGGPGVVKKINKELDKLLQQNNFKHISQAVGAEADKYTL